MCDVTEHGTPILPGRRRGGKVRTIQDSTIDLLEKRGRRLRTIEILTILTDQGVEVGGEDPLNNLSGILSRAPELTNDRAAGWGLAAWEGTQAPHVTANEVLALVRQASDEPTSPTASPQLSEQSPDAAQK